MRNIFALALAASLAATSGCSEEPTPPIVDIAAAIDKAGVTQTIEFTVKPNAPHIERGLMIALAYPRDATAASELIRTREPPMHVVIEELVVSSKVPVPIKDFRAILQANGHPRPLKPDALPAKAGDVRLNRYASDAHTSNVIVAWFPARAGVRYKATITTVVDLPEFHDVPVHILVDQYFNTGK